jgi:CheY-like chemotaxis protein
MTMQRYVTRREIRETEQEIKRLWKAFLIVFIMRQPVVAKDVATALEKEEVVEAKEKVMAPAVLVVDDDPVSAEGSVFALREAGFRVVSVSRSAEVVARLEDVSADVAILDEGVPDLGQVCSRITQQGNIPVIIVGTRPSEEGWPMAVGLGADAYLRKVTSKIELMARVKAILRRYQKASKEDNSAQ